MRALERRTLAFVGRGIAALIVADLDPADLGARRFDAARAMRARPFHTDRHGS